MGCISIENIGFVQCPFSRLLEFIYYYYYFYNFLSFQDNSVSED